MLNVSYLSRFHQVWIAKLDKECLWILKYKHREKLPEHLLKNKILQNLNLILLSWGGGGEGGGRAGGALVDLNPYFLRREIKET